MQTRRYSTLIVLIASLLFCGGIFGQSQSKISPLVQKFVTVNAPVVALEHVEVIDGTGAPARGDQTVIFQAGKSR